VSIFEGTDGRVALDRMQSEWRVAEIVVYDSFALPSEQRMVNAYIRGRYGIKPTAQDLDDDTGSAAALLEETMSDEKSNKATQFKAGNQNSKGKIQLPDWYKREIIAEYALAMVVAAGTGHVVELIGDTDETLQARKDMAQNAPLPLREASAHKIIDRRYGKVKEEIELETKTTVEKITRTVVVPPGFEPVTEVAVTSTPKEN
jgi:hypothetical protein